MASHPSPLEAGPPASGRHGAARRLLRRPGALLPIGIVGVLVLAAVLAPWITAYDPNGLDPINKFAGPSFQHWFGTDELGRDLFTRVVYGGRLALGIAVASTALALAGGLVWGGAAAIIGGVVDDALMRVGDAVMAIPFLLLALLFVAAFQVSVASLVVILGLLHFPITARIARAAILSERHADYYTAAASYGTSRARLLFSEVLPNVVPVLLVQAALVASSVILTEAALSFVGLGVQPPDASWGTLLLQGYNKLSSSDWYIVFPGLVIVLTIWCLNAISDQLQAVLDPGAGD